MHPFDDFFADFLKASPGLLTTLLVVYLFLRDRSARRKEDREHEDAKLARDSVRDAALLETLTVISSRCHDVQDRGNEVALQVVQALGSNGEIARRVLLILERVERRMNGQVLMQSINEE